MIFHRTTIDGAYRIELERNADARGFFARTYCMKEFDDHQIAPIARQASVSVNHKRGTLRGMHWQDTARAPEEKLVQCAIGMIYDVIIDLRPASPSYLKWESFLLSRANKTQLYIPSGCAHGFQTLEDDTEVLYHMMRMYAPETQLGIRYNDPQFAIPWPLPIGVIAEKDVALPTYGELSCQIKATPAASPPPSAPPAPPEPPASPP
jgi:dTDP-4-dehydrorhamnose 3,5-epimerase